MTARRIAFDVLERVDREEAFADRALDAALEEHAPSPEDRGLATRLVYGTLTWRRALDCILDDAVHGGVDSLDDDVRRVLRLGTYQIVFLSRIPDHAAVDEAVSLNDERAEPHASGLVNAVLRTIADDADDLEWWDEADRDRKPVRYLGQRYSLPNWIANRLIQIYGLSRAETLADAFNDRPPTYLRPLRDEAHDMLPLLEEIEVPDAPPSAFRATSMTDTIREGLDARRWIAQDVGSQWITRWVGASSGDDVLDGCAGRGGKTLALALDVGFEGRVVAVEPDDWKLDQLRETAEKAALAQRIEPAAGELQAWADATEETFERVLIDAPCSSLGLLRRQPEVRWRRDESDIPALVELQSELLEAGASMVAPGGILVYSVCTFTNEEGYKQVDALIDASEDFERADPPEGFEGMHLLDERGDLQLDPASNDSDVFYAARLRRRSA